ncbi:alpha/beta hydrolase, partial [Candidatus Binatia bacterium]|nr:alpha/beta hydrolase [Candidatus Binatia bacterium]
ARGPNRCAGLRGGGDAIAADAREVALHTAAPQCGAHGLALVLRHLGAADQPDTRAALARHGLPVLLIAGSADPGPLASARDLAATLPRARVLEIAGATHRAHLEQPLRVVRAATDFFRACEAERARRATPLAAGAGCASGETTW